MKLSYFLAMLQKVGVKVVDILPASRNFPTPALREKGHSAVLLVI